METVWDIRGVNKDDGAERHLRIKAPTAATAEGIAVLSGVLVESCRPVMPTAAGSALPPVIAPVRPQSPVPLRAPLPVAKRRPAWQVLFWVAGGCWVCAAVAFAVGVIGAVVVGPFAMLVVPFAGIPFGLGFPIAFAGLIGFAVSKRE